MPNPTTAQELIKLAFAQARDSGKPDWETMTLPVLKNRIIQVSKNSFKEPDLGAESFRDFLQNNADIVDVDDEVRPASTRLKDRFNVPAERQASTRRNAIRPDLWRAALDYSSGAQYVWDPRTQSAVVQGVDTQGPLLPKISAAQFDEWKKAFIDELTVEVLEKNRVDQWLAKALPTIALPPRFRGPWSVFLKNKVQVILEAWFKEQSLTPPSSPSVHPEVPPQDETEKLRDFVLNCVKSMSRMELEALALPAISAFRTAARS